ncbi:MAG TPA: flavodoxin domain-containing protein [bacterium]
MNGIVVYYSKYGATRTYAEWLSQEIGIPAVEYKTVKLDGLDPYNFIVFGSPLYLGRIVLAKTIKKHWHRFKSKRLVLFTVGSTRDPIQIDAVVKRYFTPAQLNAMPHFYMLGRSEIGRLNPLDGFLTKTAAAFTKDPEEKRMLKEGFDGMRRENLSRLVGHIKTLTAK